MLCLAHHLVEGVSEAIERRSDATNSAVGPARGLLVRVSNWTAVLFSSPNSAGTAVRLPLAGTNLSR